MGDGPPPVGLPRAGDRRTVTGPGDDGSETPAVRPRSTVARRMEAE